MFHSFLKANELDSSNDVEYELSPTKNGFEIKITGKISKVQNVLKLQMEKIWKFSSLVNQEKFNDLKSTDYIKIYEDVMAKPDYIVFERSEDVLDSKAFNDVWKEITYKSFEIFYNNWTQEAKVKFLALGDILESHVIDIVSIILKNFNSKPIKNNVSIGWSARKFPLGKITVQLSHDDPSNQGVLSYYQIGPKSMKSKCLLHLFHTIIDQPLYFRLRTSAQLSYIVYGAVEENENILWYKVIVNSSENKFTPKLVFEKINDFITVEVKEILSGMTDEKFKRFRDTVVQKKGTRLSKKEINFPESEFSVDQYGINYLKTVTKEDLLKFYDKNFIPETQRNVVFYVIKPTNDIFDLINADKSILDATSFATSIKSFDTYPES